MNCAMPCTAAMHAGSLDQLEQYILAETLKRIADGRPDLALLVEQAVQAIESSCDSNAILAQLAQLAPRGDWMVCEAAMLGVI